MRKLMLVWSFLVALAPAAIAQKDFDVVATATDANGFPLNPKWGQQVRENTLPNPVISCPPDSTTTQDWTASPQFPNCTSYPRVTFNGATGSPCGHHVNFMSVTYEGTATWAGGPTQLWPFGDQDYSFWVTRDDAALCSTANCKGDPPRVEVEFDSTETVNNWDGTGTWWERFHKNGVKKGDDQAGQMINGHHVIVIGLLGLDEYSGLGHCQEGKGHTELHPVYAMFVLVGEDRRLRQSHWAFFVRNWGNEGYCGGDQEDLLTQSIRVQIPHVLVGPQAVIAAGTRTELVAPAPLRARARNTDDLSGMSVTAQQNRGGMLLTFNLLTAEKQSWIMGDLTFQETGTEPLPATTPTATQPSSLPKTKVDEGVPPAFEALWAQINKLPESTRKQLLAQQQRAVPIKPGKKLTPTIIAEPTQLGNSSLGPPGRVVSASDLVRPRKDSEGELNRSKQLEILKKNLAKRGVQVEKP